MINSYTLLNKVSCRFSIGRVVFTTKLELNTIVFVLSLKRKKVYKKKELNAIIGNLAKFINALYLACHGKVILFLKLSLTPRRISIQKLTLLLPSQREARLNPIQVIATLYIVLSKRRKLIRSHLVSLYWNEVVYSILLTVSTLVA